MRSDKAAVLALGFASGYHFARWLDVHQDHLIYLAIIAGALALSHVLRD